MITDEEIVKRLSELGFELRFLQDNLGSAPSYSFYNPALDLMYKIFSMEDRLKTADDLFQSDEYGTCYFCGAIKLWNMGHEEDCVGVAALKFLESLK